MPAPVGAPHDPTGKPFPDLDGSGGVGPLLIQLPGEVLSSAITFKSAAGNKGVLAKLIDAAWWLKIRTDARIGVEGAAVTRIIDTVWVPTTGGAWAPNLVGGYQTSSALSSQIVAPILADTVPDGATITGFRVYVAPNTGRASLAGLTLPAVALVSVSAFGVVVSVAGISDTSATVLAYETAHTITSGAISEVVDRGQKRYVLLFNSEFGGANALAAGQLLNATITYSAP